MSRRSDGASLRWDGKLAQFEQKVNKMPQVLSKFERPLTPPASSPEAKVKKKKRIPSKWNKFKRRKNPRQEEFPSIDGMEPCQPPPEDEDWEKEIEDISRRMEKEKEMKNQMSYDPEYELSVAVGEMILYSVPSAPSPDWNQYSPSACHATPVMWVRHIHSCVPGQFADAEE